MANKIKHVHMLMQQWFRWAWITPGYMRRMPLIPRNRLFNIYLHRYTGPDNRDEGMHDHPWHSLSIRLWGEAISEWRPVFTSVSIALGSLPGENGYRKHIGGKWAEEVKLPRIVFRRAHDLHAISSGTWPVWTLFLTGPVVRKWGFFTREGWVTAEKVIEARYSLDNNTYIHKEE